jgi:dTDP-4-dehydrorhamnose 3,5-epimerase
MDITIETTPLAGLVIVRQPVARDERGYFSEVFRSDVFQAAGLPFGIAQINYSYSTRNVIRGLHFQWSPRQGKIMRVVRGEALLMAVDIRPDSSTLGRWFGLRSRAGDHQQLMGEAGFARGYGALADDTEVEYLCDSIYNPAAEGGIRWNDPAIAIDWPIKEPILSAKDRDAPTLAQWLARPEAAAFAR